MVTQLVLDHNYRCGVKVMGVTCDGNSANWHFFNLHSKEEVYKVKNPFTSEDRPIFFLSDPPQLRRHGIAGSQKRNLWVIIISNYGVVMYWFSKMRVDLAAQVSCYCCLVFYCNRNINHVSSTFVG